MVLGVYVGNTVLKKPTGVYIIAILFLLAPIGNIAISFAGSGVTGWYKLNVFLPFLQSVPAIDWVWLSLVFISGVLLFRPHKLSWSIAIITLFLVLAINAYRLYQVDSNSIDLNFLKVFSVMAIVCTLSILVIAFYFRFPYLDRRSNWIGNIQRYDMRTNAVIGEIRGVTESISMNGCRLSFDSPCEFKAGEKTLIRFLEISKNEVEVEIVETLEFGVRVEFRNANVSFKQDLSRWFAARKNI